MRNKFLKMTFMALCLSTSSALHAMNDDEAASCSSSTTSYAGKYEIRRNDPTKQPSGSVTVRQDGDHLVLENFTLTEEGFYRNHLKGVIRDTNEDSPFATECSRIANFVLSALPTEVLQLKCLRSDEKDVLYGGVTSFGELHEIWGDIEGKTPRLYVRFQREKDPFLGEVYNLSVESPFEIGNLTLAPVEQFRLFKVGSTEHDRLLKLSRLFSAPKSE